MSSLLNIRRMSSMVLTWMSPATLTARGRHTILQGELCLTLYGTPIRWPVHIICFCLPLSVPACTGLQWVQISKPPNISILPEWLLHPHAESPSFLLHGVERALNPSRAVWQHGRSQHVSSWDRDSPSGLLSSNYSFLIARLPSSPGIWLHLEHKALLHITTTLRRLWSSWRGRNTGECTTQGVIDGGNLQQFGADSLILTVQISVKYSHGVAVKLFFCFAEQKMRFCPCFQAVSKVDDC